MKRYICVPDAIQLEDRINGNKAQLVSFKQFVVATLLPDPRFARDYPSIRKAMQIDQAISSEEKVLALDPETWLTLREVAEAPQGGYAHSLAMVQLVPFIEAIMNAGDKLPEMPKTE